MSEQGSSQRDYHTLDKLFKRSLQRLELGRSRAASRAGDSGFSTEPGRSFGSRPALGPRRSGGKIEIAEPAPELWASDPGYVSEIRGSGHRVVAAAVEDDVATVDSAAWSAVSSLSAPMSSADFSADSTDDVAHVGRQPSSSTGSADPPQAQSTRTNPPRPLAVFSDSDVKLPDRSRELNRHRVYGRDDASKALTLGYDWIAGM